MAEREPLTPDFYRYRWDGLDTVHVDGRFVELRWPDGTVLWAFDHWLRENAVGAGGVDVATREGLVDPADLGPEVRVVAAAVTDSGALTIRWAPDDVEAVYHPGWLRHVADGRHRVESWLPDPVPWTADELREPPTHDGRHVLTDEDVRVGFVDDLLRYGLARLTGVPLDPDFALELAGSIGAVRATNFGIVWDVKADVDPNSTANTRHRLGPHTDLPTRETPPGVQFLHCIANTVEGGQSTMADGAAVVDYLARHHPDHYEALTTLRWIFFNRGEGIDHRWSGPIIDLGAQGPGRAGALTLRAFYPVRAFPDMDEADVPRGYAALRCFSQMAADDRFQLRYPFRPGDLVAFDNRRILHGRDRYSSGGHRHLRGLYMDHDEIRSYARVMNRRRAHHERS